MSKESTTTSQRAGAKSHKVAKAFRLVFTIVGIVACVMMVFMLICNHIVIAKGHTNADEIPSVFGLSTMYVMTDSMAPTIDGGDLVFIRKISAGDVAVNDVIAFFDPESTTEQMVVLHRVMDIIADDGEVAFITKGDGNDTSDLVAVPADNLVGVYVLRLRFMGSVAMFLQSTQGIVLSVSVPLMLLIGGEVIRWLWERKDHE